MVERSSLFSPAVIDEEDKLFNSVRKFENSVRKFEIGETEEEKSSTIKKEVFCSNFKSENGTKMSEQISEKNLNESAAGERSLAAGKELKNEKLGGELKKHLFHRH